MAQYFTPKAVEKQCMVFAVYVGTSIFDELDLELENKIKKANRTEKEIRDSVAVIRKLNVEKIENKKKCYVSYIIQNANAIKQIFPL